jgi:hypothetical protein
VTLNHSLTHHTCVYNRSLELPQLNNLLLHFLLHGFPCLPSHMRHTIGKQNKVWYIYTPEEAMEQATFYERLNRLKAGCWAGLEKLSSDGLKCLPDVGSGSSFRIARLASMNLSQPEIETSTRFFFEPYQIHHCLPYTYGQTIAFLHSYHKSRRLLYHHAPHHSTTSCRRP